MIKFAYDPQFENTPNDFRKQSIFECYQNKLKIIVIVLKSNVDIGVCMTVILKLMTFNID